MSKTEILEELPRLTVGERSQLFARLAELHETDLLNGRAPTPAERQALDEAFEELEKDPNSGEPWRDVFANSAGLASELAYYNPAKGQGRPAPGQRIVALGGKSGAPPNLLP